MVSATVQTTNLLLRQNLPPCLKLLHLSATDFDRFTHKIIKKKTAPWEQLSSTAREWSDNDDAHLRYYIERAYSISPNKKLDDAIIVVAEQNAFHPVREYLENLPDWDGVERAETLFIRVLEIPDNAYSRSISFHWLKAAVHRVLQPGCKFDYCLVIAGKQGVGKSSLFAKLGGGWFNDSIENINGKDAIEQLMKPSKLSFLALQIAFDFRMVTEASTSPGNASLPLLLTTMNH